MAFDAFLQIEGIPGESTDDKHKDWIELLSYDHEVEQPVSNSASSGGARASERANHGTFNIRKELDKASPKLFVAACGGQELPKITMELCRATGDKQTYLKVVMENVLVARIGSNGNAQGDGNLPTEDVSFNYGKITYTYTETDQKTGKSKGNVEANWNRIENKGG